MHASHFSAVVGCFALFWGTPAGSITSINTINIIVEYKTNTHTMTTPMDRSYYNSNPAEDAPSGSPPLQRKKLQVRDAPTLQESFVSFACCSFADHQGRTTVVGEVPGGVNYHDRCAIPLVSAHRSGAYRFESEWQG